MVTTRSDIALSQLFQLESKYREFEGISSPQNNDFPAKLLRGVLEVSSFSHVPHLNPNSPVLL